MTARTHVATNGQRWCHLGCEGDGCLHMRTLHTGNRYAAPDEQFIHVAREAAAEHAQWTYTPEHGDRCPEHQP